MLRHENRREACGEGDGTRGKRGSKDNWSGYGPRKIGQNWALLLEEIWLRVLKVNAQFLCKVKKKT